MTLEEAVRAGDVEQALFEVGALALGAQGLDAVASEWIAILAATAEHVREDSVRVFAEAQRGVAALIDGLENDAEGVKARSLFVVTTQLLLLRKRCCGGPGGKGRGRGQGRGVSLEDRHIAHLRERVMVHFPEGASLSDKGMERFSGIVADAEDAGEAEKALVVRIIAGLCRLYSNGEMDNLRMALEYMSRRRLAVFADESDLIGILWDILRVLDQGGWGLVATAHRLFAYQQKKKDRPLRRPLLWACAFAPAMHVAAGGSTATPVWTHEEDELLRLVATKTPELWKQVRELHKATGTGDGDRNVAEEERREEQLRLLMSYMPRRKEVPGPGSGAGAGATIAAGHGHRDGPGMNGAPPLARTFHLSDDGPSRDIRKDMVQIHKKKSGGMFG